jgi:hypothetical protein
MQPRLFVREPRSHPSESQVLPFADLLPDDAQRQRKPAAELHDVQGGGGFCGHAFPARMSTENLQRLVFRREFHLQRVPPGDVSRRQVPSARHEYRAAGPHGQKRLDLFRAVRIVEHDQQAHGIREAPEASGTIVDAAGDVLLRRPQVPEEFLQDLPAVTRRGRATSQVDVQLTIGVVLLDAVRRVQGEGRLPGAGRAMDDGHGTLPGGGIRGKCAARRGRYVPKPLDETAAKSLPAHQ